MTTPGSRLHDGTHLPFYTCYRTSPFFDATERYGCRSYQIYNHMYVPVFFDTPEAEYRHVLEHVVIVDVAAEHIVEVSGPDAFRFTNMITCRDLTTCEVGQCKYAPLIDGSGGMVNDPVILRKAADRFWIVLSDSDAGLWMRGLATFADMNVDISDPDVYALQVQGPDAARVMESLFAPEILELRYYHFVETSIDDIDVTVSRTAWTGDTGFEFYLHDANRGDDLWEAIVRAGHPHRIAPAGAISQIFRIEAGIYDYYADMTLANNPLEITGMERLVEEQEDDYLGKEALERIRREGVRRKLVGVRLSGADLPPVLDRYWPIVEDGTPLGHVTNQVLSPRLEQHVGFAWVPIERASVGSRLRAERPGGAPVDLEIARVPFVD